MCVERNETPSSVTASFLLMKRASLVLCFLAATLLGTCEMPFGAEPGGGERAEMKGTQPLCAAVVTHRDIGPGEMQTASMDLQGSLSSTDGGEPTRPGTYRFEICLDWTLEGNDLEEVLEGQFEVASDS